MLKENESPDLEIKRKQRYIITFPIRSKEKDIKKFIFCYSGTVPSRDTFMSNLHKIY